MEEITFPITLGESVGRYVPLYLGLDGKAYIMRNTDLFPKLFAGISKYAGEINQRIQVIRFGRVLDNNWNWSLAIRNLFIGDGMLTSIRPNQSRVIKVGYVVSWDTIILSPIFDIKLAR